MQDNIYFILIHANTFWIQKLPSVTDYLQAGRRVVDLFEDLRDGHNLISLLEVLAQDTLVQSDLWLQGYLNIYLTINS